MNRRFVITEYLGLILVPLTLLAIVLSNVEKLSASESMPILKWSVPKRLIGYSLIIICAASSILEGYVSLHKSQKIREKEEEVVETKKQVNIMKNALFREASGGAAIGQHAYIVDDEKPVLFKLGLRDDGSEYEMITGAIPLKLGEFRTKKEDEWRALSQKNKKNKSTSQHIGTNEKDKVTKEEICTDEIADRDCVDDLEAVASRPKDDDKLYLLTSHSTTRKGKERPSRQRFLQVSLEPGKEGLITKMQKSLRVPVLAKLKELAEKYGDQELRELLIKEQQQRSEERKTNTRSGRIQIEGLAIDNEGRAYFGFRSPLVHTGGSEFAVVMSALLDDLFIEKPKPGKFKAFLVELQHQGDSYGIVSLDYDPQSERMLALGNSPEEIWLRPILCRWRFSEANPQEFQRTTCRPIDYSGDTRTTWKPELLLLPTGSNLMFIWFDTDGKADGGQIPLERSRYLN